VITLNRVTTKNQRTLLSTTGIGIIVATAVLLAFITVPELIPSQVSAQIIPALNPDTSNVGIGSMAQDIADPVQNGTSANITQLATIPTAAPITPSTFTPLSEETGDSGDSSSNDDDDKSDSGSDNESDDSDDDNDDGDGGSSAVAIAGGGDGAFAFAG
jgi:hypothetical protein